MSIPAFTARRDQLQAELRDLVQLAREHQPECPVGGCPGPGWARIVHMGPDHTLALLAEAITRLARQP